MKCQKTDKPRYRFSVRHISFGSVPKLRNKNIYLTINKTSAMGKSFSTNHPKCSINTNCFIKIMDKRRVKKLKVKNQKYSGNIRGQTPMVFIMDD